MGINVPILPGIMCISTYGGFKVRKVIDKRQVEWGWRIVDENNEVCLDRRGGAYVDVVVSCWREEERVLSYPFQSSHHSISHLDSSNSLSTQSYSFLFYLSFLSAHG